jgi:hypothetical protein
VADATLTRLATLGLAGQAILLAAAWLLPLASEYGLIGDTISELALGRYGLVMSAALWLAGIGTIALALALRRLTEGVRGSLVGSVLVAVYGAGAVVSAIFPTEPVHTAAEVWSQGPTGTIHLWASLLSFPAMIVGMLILTRAFARAAEWRSLARWSVLLPASALALLFAQTAGPRAGLMQRLMVTAVSLWLIVVAWRIRALASRPTARGRPLLHSAVDRRVRRGALHQGPR